MIAMQYSFVLPADYEMEIIRQRIATKGPLLDNLPGLLFKAYLSADKSNGRVATAENLYAPFYLWRDEEGMHGFLASAGFAGLTQSFGWPSISTWTLWHTFVGPETAHARFASRVVKAIAPYSSLAEMREEEQLAARALQARGALAVVVGFEPGTWSLVCFSLWRDSDTAPLQPQEQRYEVGHMSLPGAAR